MKIIGGAILVLSGAILAATGVYSVAVLRVLAHAEDSNSDAMTIAGMIVGGLGVVLLIWGVLNDAGDRRSQRRASESTVTHNNNPGRSGF